MNTAKRIKSFLITLGSMAITAFSVIVFTPQWADFVAWAHGAFNSVLAGWGVPAAVFILIGAFIAEIWKQILNKIIANREGFHSTLGASRELDLY